MNKYIQNSVHESITSTTVNKFLIAGNTHYFFYAFYFILFMVNSYESLHRTRNTKDTKKHEGHKVLLYHCALRASLCPLCFFKPSATSALLTSQTFFLFPGPGMFAPKLHSDKILYRMRSVR